MTALKSFHEVVDTLPVVIKSIGRKNIMLLTDNSRIEVMTQLASKLEGASINRSPNSMSSLGCVEYAGKCIYVKPANKQGRIPDYAKNEDMFAERINQALLHYNVIDVTLQSPGKSKVIQGVVSASVVGGDVKGRKKADVAVTTTAGDVVGVSIKMDNAGCWESVGRYYKDTASRVLEHVLSEGLAELVTNEHGVSKIVPNIAIPATEDEAMDVVFGNDLRNGGLVIKRTFSDDDFTQKGDNLYINCSEILEPTEIADISTDVWFLIRNDSSRGANILPNVKGLRVLAVPSNRLTKNTLRISEDNNEHTSCN